MKKKLEAELISIAHRILMMKNKDDVKELHKQTQALYEKLSVLVFVEENFNIIKPSINIQEIEEKLDTPKETESIQINEISTINSESNEVVNLQQEAIYNEISKLVEENKQKENVIAEQSIFTNIEENQHHETTIVNSETTDDVLPKIEKENVIFNQVGLTEIEPALSEKTEQKINEVFSKLGIEDEEELERKRIEKRQIMMNELLGHTIHEPVFEKVNPAPVNTPSSFENNSIATEKSIESQANELKDKPVEDYFTVFPDIRFEKKHEIQSNVNLNDKMGKYAGISLNDKMAFEKNLFDGSTEDLNRVISQLATFDNFNDAKSFIDQMVKPDYDWNGKDEFVNRFMEFIQSKFV